MNRLTPEDINYYHAHVYYSADTKPAAEHLRDHLTRHYGDRMGAWNQPLREYDLIMGRWHDDPVGPHPRGSYQIAFKREMFGALIPLLNTERDGLTILVHPNSGDGLRDHEDLAMWLGSSVELNLVGLKPAREVFETKGVTSATAK